MKRGLIPAAWLLTAIPAPAQSPLIARARSLDLSTPYVPPPGDPLEHHAAGLAKIVCSAVFVTGLAPEFAVQNLGFFTAPYEERAKLGRPAIDRARKAVRVTLPSGVTRTAVYLGDQGCVTLPAGKQSPSFTPERVPSRLPDGATQSWPMGDVLPSGPPPPELDTAKVRRALDLAFQPADAMTAACVVTWQGRIVGERYGEGINARTPLESWSMGKTITATLMGILIRRGAYDLWQPAPVPEWRQPGDPRAKIRIADLLNVSSGQRIRPEGFVRFVSTVAPAWAADGRPIYGGFFWINGDGDLPIPRDAYFMAGAGGQFTIIIPSHDLVVVRQGHYRGGTIGTESLKQALAVLVAAVPARSR